MSISHYRKKAISKKEKYKKRGGVVIKAKRLHIKVKNKVKNTTLIREVMWRIERKKLKNNRFCRAD